MVGLPGRERSLTISSAIWIQYTNVTDGQWDGQTSDDSKDRAYALRCAVIKLGNVNLTTLALAGGGLIFHPMD